MKHVRILNDKDSGKSKGFAFVEYFDSNTALAAIKHLDQAELNGRKIKVGFPNQRCVTLYLNLLAKMTLPILSQQPSKYRNPTRRKCHWCWKWRYNFRARAACSANSRRTSSHQRIETTRSMGYSGCHTSPW